MTSSSKRIVLTVAIPAYNEQESLAETVEKSIAAAKRITAAYEILLVDDGSTDDTYRVIRRLSRSYSQVTAVRHTVNKGFSGAIRSCYRSARGDWVFLLPADGQVDPADIFLFWKYHNEADVVVGYRRHTPEPMIRKVNSYLFHVGYRLLFGVKLREISTSILWKKAVLDRIEITAPDASAVIEPEVVYKAFKSGARFAQVGIPYYPRKAGQAKGSDLRMIVRTMVGLVKLRLTV